LEVSIVRRSLTLQCTHPIPSRCPMLVDPVMGGTARVMGGSGTLRIMGDTTLSTKALLALQVSTTPRSTTGDTLLLAVTIFTTMK
jgi:hypothetical protein